MGMCRPKVAQRQFTVAIASAGFSLVGAMSASAAESFVAGTQPDRRPVNAPVLKTYEKSAQWYANALAGVSEPVPASLHFLENQGAWFTPFTRPGMTGRYDIRGRHALQQGAAAAPDKSNKQRRNTVGRG
jgi:hypothetical protein